MGDLQERGSKSLTVKEQDISRFLLVKDVSKTSEVWRFLTIVMIRWLGMTEAWGAGRFFLGGCKNYYVLRVRNNMGTEVRMWKEKGFVRGGDLEDRR